MTADGVTRRRFLQVVASGAAAAWTPAFRVFAAEASDAPPGFPDSITLYRQAYENWCGAIRVDDLWTAAPRSAQDVVAIANWAADAGYSVRPQGMRHGWSPLTVSPGTKRDARVLLVDTTEHLVAMEIVAGDPAAVRVETGALMETLFGFLEEAGYGLVATPAPGDLSVGGVLAIGGHGTAIPTPGDLRGPGAAYGCLSNLILSLTAVVWDEHEGRYVLRTFDRTDPDCKAFLTSLGRAFLTEVTLQVTENVNLRCVSRTDVTADELFAPPDRAGERAFASFVEQAGCVEAYWYAFTEKPWLKVWSASPEKPPSSREVRSPYNYPFVDRYPDGVHELIELIVKSGFEFLAPVVGPLEYELTAAGLKALHADDIWGPSKNILLYLRPGTFRLTTNGYAVLTRRQDIQRVVSEFVAFYRKRIAAHRARGRYPVNGPVYIRVTGLDQPSDVALPGAEAPTLSATAPRPDHPEWDVAVWLNVSTEPRTRGASRFFREIEEWTLQNYSGDYAAVRPEWSKGWAYTNEAAWSDEPALEAIREAHRAGRGTEDGWDWAVETLERHDPMHLFTTELHERLGFAALST